MDIAEQSFDLDEPGFRGVLRITGSEGGRRVQLSGVRAEGGDESLVEKDVPADRDEGLAELVRRCEAGDVDAAVEVLSHLGVRDPGQ